MSIAKLWANKVYEGEKFLEKVPEGYLADVETILEEKKSQESSDLYHYHILKKVEELDKVCEQTIFNGLDIPLSDGTVRRFTLTERDQLNLSGLAIKLLMGAESVAWHEDDETEHCIFLNREDALNMISTLTAYKEYHITYFRDLRIYVNTLTSVADVESITYGFALPEEAKSDVLKTYEQLLGTAK